jgi:hypothetical protein
MSRFIISCWVIWLGFLGQNGSALAQKGNDIWEWHIQYWEWTGKEKEDFSFDALPEKAKLVASIKLYRTENSESVAVSGVGNMLIKAAIFSQGIDEKYGRITIVRFSIAKLEKGELLLGPGFTREVFGKRLKFGKRWFLGGGAADSSCNGFTLTVSKTEKQKVDDFFKELDFPKKKKQDEDLGIKLAPRQSEESRNGLDAKIALSLKRDALRAVGLSVFDVNEVYQNFLAKSKSFRLSDIASIKLKNLDGKEFDLRQFADIDIQFTRRSYPTDK